MDSLTLDQVLKIFNSGETFSVKYVKFDKKRKTGGQIRYLETVVGSAPKNEENRTFSATPSKAANHFDNSTRNVLRVIDGYISSVFKTIHIYLILEVNGKKMML